MNTRVLLVMIGGESVPGGHAVQIKQTARHLRQLGLDITVVFDDLPEAGHFDVVHGFGLSAAMIRRCRTAAVPVVLSTIYWSKKYTTGAQVDRSRIARWKSQSRFAFVLARAALAGRHLEKCEAIVSRLADQRVEYEMADALLPNSLAEAKQIRYDLGVTTPMCVVPNAVDPAVFRNSPEPSIPREGALYVGRFEPHKNQLGLIRAMRGSSIALTLIGHVHPHHAEYFSRCKREGGPNVTFIDGMPQEQLAANYRKAKVHVLPSWFETTGLVSLEAALCGCNIVTTDRGYARDYFGELAGYCNPADNNSIRLAVEAACAAPFLNELRDRILTRYTWQHAAEATRAAYLSVLANNRFKQTPRLSECLH